MRGLARTQTTGATRMHPAAALQPAGTAPHNQGMSKLCLGHSMQGAVSAYHGKRMSTYSIADACVCGDLQQTCCSRAARALRTASAPRSPVRLPSPMT